MERILVEEERYRSMREARRISDKEKPYLRWYNNHMTAICLWETMKRSSTDSLALSFNDSSLDLMYLLFGKGLVSCTLPMPRPDNLKKSSTTSSSVIIVCGTEEGNIILWDTDSSSSPSATDVPYLDRILKMLQLGKTTSIQVRIPIYRSDVTVQEHTGGTCSEEDETSKSFPVRSSCIIL
jgi:hypothetical protein